MAERQRWRGLLQRGKCDGLADSTRVRARRCALSVARRPGLLAVSAHLSNPRARPPIAAQPAVLGGAGSAAAASMQRINPPVWYPPVPSATMANTVAAALDRHCRQRIGAPFGLLALRSLWIHATLHAACAMRRLPQRGRSAYSGVLWADEGRGDQRRARPARRAVGRAVRGSLRAFGPVPCAAVLSCLWLYYSSHAVLAACGQCQLPVSRLVGRAVAAVEYCEHRWRGARGTVVAAARSSGCLAMWRLRRRGFLHCMASSAHAL